MKIITRKDTGLPIFPDNYYQGPYKKIGVCVHNMAVGTSESITLDQAKRQTMINYNYHRSRWNAIDILEGYDLYNVNGEATILECRPWWSNCDAFSGMATLGYKYIGIEVCGDFDTQKPNPVVIEGLIEFIIYLYETGKINDLDIKGHRDFNAYSKVGPTSCPGNNLYILLPYIREEVNKRLSSKKTGGVRIMLPSPEGTKHVFPDVWVAKYNYHLHIKDESGEKNKATIIITKRDGSYFTLQEVEINPFVDYNFGLNAILKEKGITEACSLTVFTAKNSAVYLREW